MKRAQKFAFANSSSHGWFDMVERLKMAILIRERTQMLDFFGMYLLLRYKAIGLFKEFWREVPKFDIFKSPQKAIK